MERKYVYKYPTEYIQEKNRKYYEKHREKLLEKRRLAYLKKKEQNEEPVIVEEPVKTEPLPEYAEKKVKYISCKIIRKRRMGEDGDVMCNDMDTLYVF